MANESETVMAVCAEWRDCIESADPTIWNDGRIAGLVKTTKAQQLAYLARIEAAWKLEAAEIEVNAAPLPAVMLTTKAKIVNGGNAAAMREALVAALPIMRNCPFAYYNTTDVDAVVAVMERAISAPARNCDMFADELDAQLAFLNEVWLISVDRETMLEQDKYEYWTNEMRQRYGRWLLAPAAERKGE